ncbi:MAG: sigma-70 family RNA polymerase sigma factor, partial [Alistipes sp.]|nr:sigma-70 family RNA polymerase sigma factor [Alistipes sp.]
MKERNPKLALLERIVEREQERLFRFACLRTGSRADAEDIVQEVLLRLFRSECDLTRIDDVERYLWRAIANRCTDFHRRRRFRSLAPERIAEQPEEAPDPELLEESRRIARLLDTLP